MQVLGLGGGLPQPVRKERPATAGRQESLPEGSAARMVLGLGGGLPKKPLAQLPNGIAKVAATAAASGLPTPVDQTPPPVTNVRPAYPCAKLTTALFSTHSCHV